MTLIIVIVLFIGCPPRIPPKAWSVFIIELISWIDCTLIDKLHQLKTHDEDITDDFNERLRIAEAFRDMGNVNNRSKEKRTELVKEISLG